MHSARGLFSYSIFSIVLPVLISNVIIRGEFFWGWRGANWPRVVEKSPKFYLFSMIHFCSLDNSLTYFEKASSFPPPLNLHFPGRRGVDEGISPPELWLLQAPTGLCENWGDGKDGIVSFSEFLSFRKSFPSIFDFFFLANYRLIRFSSYFPRIFLCV